MGKHGKEMNTRMWLVLVVFSGLPLLWYAVQPLCYGKYVITETSLKSMRQEDVPEAIVTKVSTFVGQEFFFSMELQRKLSGVLDTNDNEKYGRTIRSTTRTRLSSLEAAGFSLLTLLLFAGIVRGFFLLRYTDW